MTKVLLIGGLASILMALAGTLLALRIQYRWFARDRIERQAWEYAQEMSQLNWEKQQIKGITDFEGRVEGQLEQIRGQWMEWEVRGRARINRMRLEYELMRLPSIDEMPLSLQSPGQAYTLPDDWNPPIFDKADLRGQDFSHRYLGHTYLREADLRGAVFYMADLRNACLAGADLSGANLAGANLSGADLRGARLSGASLLVADLRNTLLHGANLLGARNLTIQQVYAAHYDHTTLLDPELDLTMPRLMVVGSSVTDPGITPEQIPQVISVPPAFPATPGSSALTNWSIFQQSHQ